MRVKFIGKNASQGLKGSDSSSIVSEAKKIGLEIVESLDDDPDFLVCVDYKRAVTRIVREAKRRNIPVALIMLEPEVVIPQHGRNRLERLFGRVVRIGRPEQQRVIEWPQTWRAMETRQERINAAVLANADKWSFIYGQLYWLRAAVANKNAKVHVFGYGWDRSLAVRIAHRSFEIGRTLSCGKFPNFRGVQFVIAKPRNYLGVVEDKVNAMSKYKVALVIENSLELMTEKLFDAWFAGCIPVYVGPDVGKFGLPKDLVISCEPTLVSIQNAIELASAMDLGEFQTKLSVFLGSKEAESWMSDRAIKAALEEALGSKISS